MSVTPAQARAELARRELARRERARAKKDMTARADQLRGKASDGRGRMGAALNGAIVEFGDEAAGLEARFDTAFKNLGRRVTGKPIPYTSAQAAAAMTQIERERQGAFDAAHPAQAAGFRVLGGVVGAGKGAGAAMKGARGLGSTVARSAGVGAAYGAVSGAGAAEGGAGNRAAGATKGAALGGVVGGAVPIGSKALSSGLRAVNNAAGNKVVPAAVTARQRLRDALRADGLDANKLDRAVSQWVKTGIEPPALLDVAGENTRALLRAAASKAGPARNRATEYAEQTRENLPGRAIARARQLTPDRRSAGRLREDIAENMSAVDDELYPAFQDERVPVGDDIRSAVAGATGAKALRYARRIADARQDYRALGEIEAIAEGGEVQVSAGTLDLIRRGLRDTAGQAARAGDNSIAGGLSARQHEVETALLDVEGFDAARSAHARSMRQAKAVDTGGSVLEAMPDEFGSTVEGLSYPEQLAARVGGRQALTDSLGKSAVPADVLRKVAHAENPQRNLSALYGEDEAARYSQSAKLELERLKNANYISPNAGSQTETRLSDNAALQAAGTVAKAVGGSGMGMLDTLGMAMRGPTMNAAERDALVSLGTRPPTMLELFRESQRQRQLEGAAALTGSATAGQMQRQPPH